MQISTAIIEWDIVNMKNPPTWIKEFNSSILYISLDEMLMGLMLEIRNIEMGKCRLNISQLATLAEQRAVVAPAVVQLLVEHLCKTPSTHKKLQVLYVIDVLVRSSIVPVKEVYRKRFSNIITNLFVELFTIAKCTKTRIAMHKIRSAWGHNIFPAALLYNLDLAVNKIDKAWPIHKVECRNAIDANNNLT